MVVDLTHVWFDRDGKPITSDAWRQLFLDSGGRTICHDRLEDGTLIWTGWHGLAFTWDAKDRPEIFHTFVLWQRDGDRKNKPHTFPWATETEARVGHDQVVAMLRGERAKEPAAVG